MSQQLINRSPDLKRLRDEGYEIEVKSGYLLVHHIPYLDANKEVRFGTLVTDLTMNGEVTARPSYHVIHFMGQHPCDKQGRVITAIQLESREQVFLDGVVINHSFSNKPSVGYYDDYHHKVSRYADIISAPAKSLYGDLTEKTFKPIATESIESVFQYYDTNTSRANIAMVNSKLNGQKIAIIGLGGTGAYILDSVAKTPVQEIHIFDGDIFHTHNAFRSPGAASLELLNSQPLKVNYYAEMYSKMHRGIIPHPYYLVAENMHLIAQMDFVFICVDKNQARNNIARYLAEKGISFTDVGLGVNIVGSSLVGMVRVTACTQDKNDHLSLRLPAGEADNEYSSNIQIAELNSLNANLAVIKWKKLNGFYADTEQEFHTLFSVQGSELFHEDKNAATLLC
jgi:molybdopterin/thiamine biosynthesis adenylyltransferase